MKYLLTIMVLSTLFIACKKETKQNQQDTDQNEVVAEETDQWINLLDGNSAEGWRAYNGESLPPGWVVNQRIAATWKFSKVDLPDLFVGVLLKFCFGGVRVRLLL